MYKRLDMKIYNTDIFEKFKIRPVNVNELSHYKVVKNVLVDVEGNSYDGIVINNKMWIASNLRTSRFNDGVKIEKFYYGTHTTHSYYTEDIFKDKERTGYYYNYHCINSGRLAPRGWHIPTIQEWEDMLKYVASKPQYNLSGGLNPWTSNIAKSLCSVDGWKQSITKDTVGQDCTQNNITGFDLYPAGYYNYYMREFAMFGTDAICICACDSINSMMNQKFFCVNASNDNGYIRKLNKMPVVSAYTVRCIKD